MNKEALNPSDALEMLASAVNYCQAAGLIVKAGNVSGALALIVEGALLLDNPKRFVPIDPVNELPVSFHKRKAKQ